MYDAAEDTAGIIKPVRIQKLYFERYQKHIDESEIMRLANKTIEDLEKHGKPSIIKYESEDGTIYMHVGKFEEWLTKSRFLDDLRALFSNQILKTKGLRSDIEKNKLEDFLIEYGIPRGLASEIVLDALCRKGYLIKKDAETYTMPDVREIKKKSMITSKFRSVLEKKVFLPEDDLITTIMQEVNKEFEKANDTVRVSEGDVRMVVDELLGDRYVRVKRSVDDKKIDTIVDTKTMLRIIDESEPLIIEKLKNIQMDKIGSGAITSEDVVKVVEEVISTLEK